jgi:hypothetical protein
MGLGAVMSGRGSGLDGLFGKGGGKGGGTGGLFGKGGGKGGGMGGLFGKDGGGLGGLTKKKKKQLRFQKKLAFCEELPTSSDQEKIAPTDRMRELDSMRMHRPTDNERKILALPESKERVLVHSLGDVMLLCGGRRGIRFSGDELRKLTASTTELEARFKNLETIFNSLPSSSRRKILAADVTSVGTLPEEGEETSMPFHRASNSYLDEYHALEEICRAKMAAVQKQAESGEEMPKPDPEFDEKSKQPFPEWLMVLIARYLEAKTQKEEEQKENQKASPAQQSGSVVGRGDPGDAGKVDSLSRLSSFLGCCVFELNQQHHQLAGFNSASAGATIGPFKTMELRALQWLVRASVDLESCEQCTSSSSAGVETAKPTGVGGGMALTGKAGRQYWTMRIFTFLSKLRELKSIRKDERRFKQALEAKGDYCSEWL